MAAPKRIPNWALVLSPLNGEGVRYAVNMVKQASRTAHQQGLTPIFPLIYCLSFMTEEEVSKDLLRVTQYWARRVSKIWICLQPGEVKLDPIVHDVLLFNEGHMRAQVRRYDAPSRLPVYRFWVQDTGTPGVQLVERAEVNTLLRRNVMDGLFRGFNAA